MNFPACGLAGKPFHSLTRKRLIGAIAMNWQFWAVLSAVFAGITAVLAKFGVPKDIDSNLATAIRTAVIVVFAWVLVFCRGLPALDKVAGKTWLFLVLSGAATAASWLCYFRALQLGEVSRVAPVDKLSVVVAMGLAVLLLGEHLAWQHWLAGLLIVSGTIILAWT
jgi:transporter family protein